MEKGYTVYVNTLEKDRARQEVDVCAIFQPSSKDLCIHLVWCSIPNERNVFDFNQVIVSSINVEVLVHPEVPPLLAEIAKIDANTQPEEFVMTLQLLGFRLILG